MARPDLSTLLVTFKIPADSVLNVYVVGSRLWGTHKPSSDHDLLIVLQDPVHELSNHHRTNYDITLLSQSLFVQRVREGYLIETICSLLGDNEACVWQRRMSTRGLVKDTGPLSEWLVAREEVDREKASKFWQKGLREAGFKILQHTLTSELLLLHLRKKAGELGSSTLTMDEIHAVVHTGRRDADWVWLGTPWEEAVQAHRERLAEIRRSS